MRRPLHSHSPSSLALRDLIHTHVKFHLVSSNPRIVSLVIISMDVLTEFRKIYNFNNSGLKLEA